MNVPLQPWEMHSKSGVWVTDRNGAVIARTYCDAPTSNKTYNEQFAQAENLAFLLVRAPVLIEALTLCVAAIDNLMPGAKHIPADIGLINDALILARPLVKELT